MTKFQHFVKDHTPSDVVVSLQALEEACKTEGFTFSVSAEKVRIAKGEGHLSWEQEKGSYQVTLHYRFAGVEGDSALYRAESPLTELRGPLYKEVNDKVVPVFAPQVKTDLPEQVISLPVPQWVEISGNDPWAQIVTPQMFESEAVEALASLETELRKIMG